MNNLSHVNTVNGVIFDLDGTLVSSSLDFSLMRKQIGCPSHIDILSFLNDISNITVKRHAEKVIEALCSVLQSESATPAQESKSECSLVIGDCYLIRTVTMMYTGRLMRITHSDLALSDAAWIADSGRYSKALETGDLEEVEPYPCEVIISRGALVDAAKWAHPLPRETK